MYFDKWEKKNHGCTGCYKKTDGRSFTGGKYWSRNLRSGDRNSEPTWHSFTFKRRNQFEPIFVADKFPRPPWTVKDSSLSEDLTRPHLGSQMFVASHQVVPRFLSNLPAYTAGDTWLRLVVNTGNSSRPVTERKLCSSEGGSAFELLSRYQCQHAVLDWSASSCSSPRVSCHSKKHPWQTKLRKRDCYINFLICVHWATK